MLFYLKHKKAQSTAECAILIAVVVGAAVAMQTYVKRSLQGGIKFVVDKSTKKGGTAQYEPYYLESSYDTTVKAYKDSEETKVGGGVVRTFGVGDGKTTNRSGYQKIKDTSSAD